MSAKNRFALVVTMATAVVITYAALKCFQPFVLAASLIKPWLTRSFYLPLAGLFKHTLISPEFYVVVALTLLLQKLFPADPKQKSFNISLAQDSLVRLRNSFERHCYYDLCLCPQRDLPATF